MTITERSTPLSRHLRMIASDLIASGQTVDDTHAAESINTAADILEAIAEKPAMTVNAQTMLELAEAIHKARWPEDRTMFITEFADEDQNARDYCFRIARAVAALRSPAIAGVAAREALERIIKIDQLEKKITVETDPAGNTYRVEMIDGPCATVARDAIAALPQEVPAQPQAETYTDPAELWDRYCEEVPAKRRSPQGAMAFAVDALTSAQPQADAVREITEDAVMAALRAANLNRRPMIVTKWQDDICIDEPSHQAMTFARAIASEGKP